MAEHRATAALAKPHRRHGNRPYLDSITGTGGVAQLSLLGGQKFALRFAPCPLTPNNGSWAAHPSLNLAIGLFSR